MGNLFFYRKMYYHFDNEIEQKAIHAYHHDPWSDSEDEDQEHLAITDGSVVKEGGEIELGQINSSRDSQFEGGTTNAKK